MYFTEYTNKYDIGIPSATTAHTLSFKKGILNCPCNWQKDNIWARIPITIP